MDQRWKVEAIDRPAEAEPAESLAERLAEEMAAAWRRGDRPRAEEYLALHPEMADRPGGAVRLIYEEVCLGQEHGQEVPLADLASRFPRWKDELELLLDCHQLLDSPPAAPHFPRVGERMGDFLLLAELGRGAWGLVFLAAQPALAERPVVLKLAPRDGAEHHTLARLQHTHIVPLYSVHDDPARRLRALCMPYLGGASLARLLEVLRDRPPALRTGRDLLRALDLVQSGLPVIVTSRGQDRMALDRLSYVGAVCWIGACLADALQHAHERDLLHLDLKPSNVLLSCDAQPMLLDFHLARGPIRAGGPPPARIGGSPAYMPPEQRAALDAVRRNHAVPSAVDGRADVYALGLILQEALGGDVPLETAAATRTLRRRNPRVSVGLADILRKCLAPDPRDRYPGAAALATDLRRHLADLPLGGVANRSPVERWRKWRRRKPHAPALAGMLLAVVLSALLVGHLGWARVGQRLREAGTALADGREQLKARRHPESVATLARGLALAEGLPGGRDLARQLGGQLRRARRAEAADRLHRVADRLRLLSGTDPAPAGGLGAVEARCRAIWGAREQLVARAGAELDPELERRIEFDLLDLAILWVDVRVRLAPGDEMIRARHEALRVLTEAEAMLAPSHVLYRERQVHAEALGLAAAAREAARRAAELAPRTAWEHDALGRSLLRAGELERAASEFERALELEADGFWYNFDQGVCAHRLRRHEEAVAAFRTCIALAPGSAACYFNRALALEALGRTELALDDYGRALELDPELAGAALNRGVLYHQARRHAEAISEFERALRLGADAASVYYNLALVYLGQGDRAAARESLELALRDNPGHEPARVLCERLRDNHRHGTPSGSLRGR